MSFIDDLENSVDIVDIVGRYAKLKKSGTSYKALCPFPGHSEKTPSFVVSPVKQIGYCFGCHKGGGPLKFIMDMENCEFREAVQMLGSITGREIQGFTENKEKIQIKKNLYSLYKDATNYYKNALQGNPEIKKYLMDRGMSSEDIESFHFGYADSGVGLYNYLKEKGYEDEQIEQSAIFLDIRQRKDKFIGRVIFPIQNLRGDFVAFAGRIVGQGEPKYLNSPASDIYDKSSILYGLYEARKTITKVDHIIITEGYMDTIALHRYGFFQTVAVSGTALTEKHITIIKRLTHKVYLCFDNDKAGEQATRNSLELLKNNGLEVKIIHIVGSKDPDEYLESGKDFQILIDTALSPIAFFIKKNNYNLSSIDEKKKFLTEIFEIIANYSDSIEQDNYLKELASMSQTPLKIIYEMYAKRNKAPSKKVEILQTTELSPEDYALAYLLEQPQIATLFVEEIIFPNDIGEKLQKALQNPENFFVKIDMNSREKYRALSLQNSKKAEEGAKTQDDIKNLCLQINRLTYKKLSEKYKQEMQAGETQALQKYSELLQIAKKHRLK